MFKMLGLKCSKLILSVVLPRAFSSKQLGFTKRAFGKEQYIRLYWDAETLNFKVALAWCYCALISHCSKWPGSHSLLVT